jgi:hypothetical protein
MTRSSIIIAALALASLTPTARAQEEALTRERIEAALARYRYEPTVTSVVRTALAAGDADPARARDAIDRARLAGLLPVVRAGLRRGQAVDLRALTSGTGERTNVYTDDDLMLEASVVFRLDRLLFATDEPALLRELRALEEARAQLVRAVVALYFERRRLQLERDLLGRRDLPSTLRILEIEALLDLMTDGAFRRAREP